jgi:hypothetical protein
LKEHTEQLKRIAEFLERNNDKIETQLIPCIERIDTHLSTKENKNTQSQTKIQADLPHKSKEIDTN